MIYRLVTNGLWCIEVAGLRFHVELDMPSFGVGEEILHAIPCVPLSSEEHTEVPDDAVPLVISKFLQKPLEEQKALVDPLRNPLRLVEF